MPGARLISGERRDRLIVLVSLAALVALAWAYLFQLAGDMPGMAGPNAGPAEVSGMAGMDMPGMAASPAGPPPSQSVAALFAVTAVMWVVMMVGMMVPSAAPTVLL